MAKRKDAMGAMEEKWAKAKRKVVVIRRREEARAAKREERASSRSAPSPPGYVGSRLTSNAIHAESSANVRDIAAGWAAEEPSQAELALKERCRLDLRLFLESYFPHCFTLEWSPDHLRVIEAIQRVVLEGGQLAIAMPRGDGKTSILERAAMWAMLYGHHSFVCVVGATEDHGDKISSSIKVELENNELLRRPFRAACYPVRRLEGEARRCGGQTFNRVRTHIAWGDKRLTLATLPGEECSGAIVSACGLTGSVRGQKVTRPDGKVVRPGLVLVDDPQTRESAMSPTQVAERLAIIHGDLMGLGGPGAKVSVFAAVTVIRTGDLADELLDRDRRPEWRGERIPAVRRWPTNQALWDKYADFWATGQRSGEGAGPATRFYAANRKAMDEGSEVSWEDRKEEGDLSGIQHQFNLKLKIGEAAYSAEYQNQPTREEDVGMPMLSAKDITAKVDSLARGVLPFDAEHLTAFIDVHDTLLFWAVVAWSGRFDGWVVDYGVFPDQPSFTSMRRAQVHLSSLAPGGGRVGAIRAGLDQLAERLLSKEYEHQETSSLRVERCLVDSGYVPDVVHDFCRASPHSAVLMPSRGRHVAPQHKPIEEFNKRPGERIGFKWHIPAAARGRQQRVLIFDSNFWKSFVHARLATLAGDVGCLELFGRRPQEHAVLADHLLGEYPTRVTANGRTVDVWQPRPSRENHWFDCLVGCAVAASERGASLPGAEARTIPRKRVSLSALSESRKSTQTAATEQRARIKLSDMRRVET